MESETLIIPAPSPSHDGDSAGRISRERKGIMSAKEIADKLADLLEDSEDDGLVSVRTFEDCGVLTRDEGFVIRYDNSEYQITVVQS